MSGVSDDPEAAAGSGGMSRKTTSAIMAYPPNAGSSQAPAANTGVGRATVDGSEKQASAGDRKVTETALAHMEKLITDTDTKAVKEPMKKTINIGNLGEDQLLVMIQGYVKTMSDFAGKTRNVHKELKETLLNTEKVLTQYMRVRKTKKVTHAPRSHR